jgi:hypothetical protein
MLPFDISQLPPRREVRVDIDISIAGVVDEVPVEEVRQKISQGEIQYALGIDGMLEGAAAGRAVELAAGETPALDEGASAGAAADETEHRHADARA